MERRTQVRQIIYRQLNKDYAYWTEKRAIGQIGGGHTAGLLTHIENGRVVQNILIDVGLGTLEALADFCDESFWEEPLTVFITHGHIDHHAELMIFSEIYSKRRGLHRNDRRPPLEVFCGEVTYKHLLATHRFGFTGGNTLTYNEISAGQTHQQGIFQVTPIAVDHFEGAMIFAIEFEPHKIVIGWDMTTLPSDPTEIALLSQPSLALIEATTWQPGPTGHTCIEALVGGGFLESLDLTYDPSHEQFGAYLLHYSGWEDAWGTLTDEALKARFDVHYPQLASLVRVAERGQVWIFT
jgi:phosphoribosyl 1,2-cyclic phosphodiesterase